MIKHYCDLCNKEIKRIHHIELDRSMVGPSTARYEVCLECLEKLRNYIKRIIQQ